MGASNKYDPNDQLDQVALYWLNMSKGETAAADRAGAGQGPRRAAGHRRRQPDPPAGRAERRGGADAWPSCGRAGTASRSCSWPTTAAASAATSSTPCSASSTRRSHVTLIDVVGDGTGAAGERRGDRRDPPSASSGPASSAATVDSVVVRGEPGPMIVQTALEGRFDAIFMSLRGEYRALDTIVLATNTRYVLQHAPCRVILGFAPSRSSRPPRARPRRKSRDEGGGKESRRRGLTADDADERR